MKIAIIHDFDHHERFKRLTEQITEQNVQSFKFFPAIHDPHSTRKGINLAHKQCVQWAKDNQFKEVCIWEDDVKFTHPTAFQYFLDKKPIEYDIYLSGIYLGDILPDSTVKSFSGLHCYIVQNKFYDTFLSLPDDEHIDRALSGLGKFVVCYPFAAIQFNGFSYNTKTDMDYDYLLEGKEFYKD